jgi:dephospho-CoA kinase
VHVKLVIGLIGGMGSGKSAVAAELARHGACVISGDRLGHEALEQPEIKKALIERWGNGIFGADGRIDRSRLGKIVFADPAERNALESLVFPWIGNRVQEEIALAWPDPRMEFIVLDAAVMLEAGWNRVCDRLLFVDAPDHVRLERLATQRGWSQEDVNAREKAQMPLLEKRKVADAVLENAGSAEELAQRVNELVRRWGLASEAPSVHKENPSHGRSQES